MISYTSGNILESPTSALVNTVNCDGYMGKGIAYQFKLKFPFNNEKYEKACKSGNFRIGDILIHEEQNKIILNFPTKDHWRNKSKIEYIEKGLLKLIDVIRYKDIKSISIPPLGCGNGGLKWKEVKPLIENYLKPVSDGREIFIFEPVENYSLITKPRAKTAPKLNTSHLLLMLIKIGLKKFNKTRLQKAAYLINVVSGQDYFKFEAHNFGPYAHSLDILSRNIKEYQDYYNINTETAFNQVVNTLISSNTVSKLNSFQTSLSFTLNLVNSISDDSKLELYTTIIYLIQNDQNIAKDNITFLIHSWNEHKKISFGETAINEAIVYLMQKGLIYENLYHKLMLNGEVV